MRICIVISTGGSVINKLLQNSFFKTSVHSIVTDRPCQGVSIAEKHNIFHYPIHLSDKRKFSKHLLTFLERNRIDLVVSFYLKLFEGEILSKYKNRILNLHLSLLPAFSGFKSFESALGYGVKYIGTTIHFIDDTVDNGTPILQSVVANNPSLTDEEIRHKLFVHQCKSLLQVIKWINDDRIIINNNKCKVKYAKYDLLEFSPNLDFSEAIELH